MNNNVLGSILIVDDMPGNLRLLSQMLTEQGYKVRAVRSGAQAITAAQASPPDLILLDIVMPEMDGYAVCQHLKADKRTSDIPILFISALDELKDKVMAFTSGGVDYITKPFQTQEVLARVRTHLTLRSLNRELQAANAELARQIEQLQAARDRQAVLRQVGIDLSYKLSLDHVLNTAIDAAIHLSMAEAIFIALVEGDCLTIVRALGEYETTTSISIHEGITGRAVREGRAEFVPDVRFDPDYKVFVPGTVAQISIPLITQSRVVGTLTLETEHADRFSDAVFEGLNLLAAQVAVAIDNAMAYEERARLIGELDAFAHTVAHDLKNPLAHVIGYSELAYSYCKEGNIENLSEYMEAISRASMKMNDIINALLLLASVREAEDVNLSALDMQSIVEEAQHQLSDLIEKTQAQITLPATWPVSLGYAPWMEEIWTNYISNAIKYGGAPPQVELGADRQPDGMLRFWVRDNGDGISLEDQARLFTPFTRLGQVRVEGHGLGLSIVQRIVEKLGGQAGVESEGVAGRGSLFYFTLPPA